MFICNECKQTFSTPNEYYDDYGWDVEEGHIAAYQTVMRCPYCYCEEFEEAAECEMCHDYYSKKQLHITDDMEYVCPDCCTELNNDDYLGE